MEIYAALVPSLATIPGAMLIGISTPYRRAGLLYQKWKDHFGQDDDDVLVVHGGSRIFNPTLPERIVADALKRDAAAARSEWLAEWRDDIAAFLTQRADRGRGRPRRAGQAASAGRRVFRLRRPERRPRR